MPALQDFSVRSKQHHDGPVTAKLPAKDSATSNFGSNKNENENKTAGPEETPKNSESHANGVTAASILEEDPFGSEASKILFDKIDKLRSCGAAAALQIDLPQLVIVGQQSAGKSSLLRSLTDIPFPVGDGLCTRFATRIISRRSSPGSIDTVKISIETNGSGSSPLTGERKKKPFNPHVATIDAAVFSDVFKQASEYMGITGPPGTPIKNNFSSKVLRIELEGPNRSHFGILDVPGVFHALTDTVTDEDMKRVRDMVTSHMKKPESIIICVAPATDNLANQDIFTMAKQHAAPSRVVGVFTKCDKAPNPKNIVRIVRDNTEIALQNGWFVIQNIPEDAPPGYDREAEEKATFNRSPWTEILSKQRGTAELKKFLAHTLSSRIRRSFPKIQTQIQDLLEKETRHLMSLGIARPDRSDRLRYLNQIVSRYQELAKDCLGAPWRLRFDDMKLRGKTHTALNEFAKNMTNKGHTYTFVDANYHGTDIDLKKAPLYEEIRRQLGANQGEELPGMTNPAVIKPLFIKQTSEWIDIGREYLQDVIDTSREVTLLILESVSLELNVPVQAKERLKNTIHAFETKASEKAHQKLDEYFNRNSKFLLSTTNEQFKIKVKEAQVARFTAALNRYWTAHLPMDILSKYLPPDTKDSEVAEKNRQAQSELIVLRDQDDVIALFDQIHPRAITNTEDEVHDVLKAYYEIALEDFKSYISQQIVEEYLHDPRGPIFGLSSDYVSSELTEHQLDILGGEDELVVEARQASAKKVRDLEEAVRISAET